MLIQRMMLGSRVQDKTTWDLGYTIADDAASKQIYVPLWNTDYIDTDKMTVDWGDGTFTTVTGPYSGGDLNPLFVHTYNAPGSYVVKMSASPETWSRTRVGQSGSTTYGYTTNLTTVYSAIPHIAGSHKASEISNDSSLDNSKHIDVLFKNSTSLVNIPSDIFRNNTDAVTFNETFGGCSALSLTEDMLLFAGCSEVVEFRDTFGGIKGGRINRGLFNDCTKASDFGMCFSGFLHSTNPEWFPNDSPTQDGLMQGLFQSTSARNLMGCFSYSSVPNILGLFDGCDKLEVLNSCFYGTTIGEFYKVTKPYDGQPVKYNWYNLFDDCVNLYDITGLFYNAVVPFTRFVLPNTIDIEDKWYYRAQAYPVARFANSPRLSYIEYSCGLTLTGNTTNGRGSFDAIILSDGNSGISDKVVYTIKRDMLRSVEPGFPWGTPPITALSGSTNIALVIPSGSVMEQKFKYIEGTLPIFASSYTLISED